MMPCRQKHDCQPNYRVNVVPDPLRSCGPYHPAEDPQPGNMARTSEVAEQNHDTISVVAIDKEGRIAAGSSSNGINHKASSLTASQLSLRSGIPLHGVCNTASFRQVPGRVGDASVAGGGAYAESGVGGCASTGDGDLHLRFLPCYQVS